MDDYTPIAGPSSPPRSPTYPPLLSASLYPPPPPVYKHFTPLHLHFHSILTSHWPSKGSQDEDDLYIEQGDGDSLRGWTPRLKLQRRILLQHASTLASLPTSTRSLHPELRSDTDVQAAIHALGRLDLKFEMDPPDLDILQSQRVGGYMAFGQWRPIPPKEAGVEEAGVRRLYDEEVRDEHGRIDRRPALVLLLRTLVATYLKLLSLLQYPPSYTSIRTLHSTTSNFSTTLPHRPDGDTPAAPAPGSAAAAGGGVEEEEITWQTSSSLQWNHIRTLVLNIQEVLNRSRSEQAKSNLEAEIKTLVLSRRKDVQRIKEVLRVSRERMGNLMDHDDDGRRRRRPQREEGSLEEEEEEEEVEEEKGKKKRVKIELAPLHG